jgi:hypothetical protein
MDEPVRSFLNQHGTAARWLDDIIDTLIERRGTAHVRDIAREVAKVNDARDKDTVEQIVTRRLNDFCWDAADFSKRAARYAGLFVRATLWFPCHGVEIRGDYTGLLGSCARGPNWHGASRESPQSQITSLNRRAYSARGEGMGSMGYPIAYSPRALAKAFDPPLSERLSGP